MKKRKIFVSGYWHTNVGDDLFLTILCKRYPELFFVVFTAPGEERVFQNIKNLKTIKTGTIMALLDRLLMHFFSIKIQDIYAWLFTDNYVEIGGSIFIENNYWKKRYRERTFNLRHTNKYFIIGSNFGPFNSDEFLHEYKVFLRDAKVVFRDFESQKMIGGSNIMVAPDVVFDINNYFNVPESDSKNIRYVVISVINLQRRKKLAEFSTAYEVRMLKLAQYFIRKGYSIKILEFCEYERDDQVADRIYSHFTHSEKQFVEKVKHNNLVKTLSVLYGANKIIATRFHAVVIALANQIPVLPIIYSDKTSSVLSDISQQAAQSGVSIESLDDYDDYQLNDHFLTLNNAEVERLRTHAQKQFYYLDRSNEQV